MSEKIELRVDRTEDRLSVAFDKNGEKYEFCTRMGKFEDGTLLSAQLDENRNVISVERDNEATEKQKTAMKRRLKSLFDRK